MNLSNIKTILPQLSEITFQLEDGSIVPAHFHVTEIGQVTKKYIDCGGTIRHDNKINFQLWTADDFDHRLAPSKLLDIIALSEKYLNIEDAPIEVEYQGSTIMTFDLDFDKGRFILRSKQTDCLAKGKCGIPEKKDKPRLKLSDIQVGCMPNSGCC